MKEYYCLNYKKVHDLLLQPNLNLSMEMKIRCAGMLASLGDVKKALAILDSVEKEVKENLRENHMGAEAEHINILYHSVLGCISELRFYYSYAINEYDLQGSIRKKDTSYSQFFPFPQICGSVTAELLANFCTDMKTNNTAFHLQQTTYRINAHSAKHRAAYYLYHILECCGFPLQIHSVIPVSSSLMFAVNQELFEESQFLGLRFSLMRNGKDWISCSIGHLFIEQNQKLSQGLFDFVLKSMRRNISSFSNHYNPFRANVYSYLLLQGLECIIRFSSNCSIDQEYDVMQLALDLLEDDILDYIHASALLEYLFLHISESVKASFLPKLLLLEPGPNATSNYSQELNPVTGIIKKEESKSLYTKVDIPSDYIERLLQEKDVNEICRNMRMEKLITLSGLDLLSYEQEKIFCSQLWANLDSKNNLPKLPKRFLISFLSLPHPKEVDPVKLIKNVLLTSPLYKQNSSVLVYDNFEDRYLREVQLFCEYYIGKNQTCWTEEEGTRLVNQLNDYMEKVQKNEELLFSSRIVSLRHVIQLILDTTDYQNSCHQSPNELIFEISKALCMDDENILSVIEKAYYYLRKHLLPPSDEERLIQLLCIFASGGNEHIMLQCIIILHNLAYIGELRITEQLKKYIESVFAVIDARYGCENAQNEEAMKSRLKLLEARKRFEKMYTACLIKDESSDGTTT